MQALEAEQQPAATKQAPAQSDEPAPAAPAPKWDLNLVQLDGYGVRGEVSEPLVLELERNADFRVNLVPASLDAQHFHALLAKETLQDKALALSVRVLEQLERKSRSLRVRVVPNRPSDGVYWVRYRPETEGTRILQVELSVERRELPGSPILVRRDDHLCLTLNTHSFSRCNL